MTEKYSFKAYLALFNLLDLKFEKSKDSQLGRLLGDMNPNLFADDTSINAKLKMHKIAHSKCTRKFK